MNIIKNTWVLSENLVAHNRHCPLKKRQTSSFMALVYVSLDDYRRPLDKVSTTQSATLAATGLIWTRYCLIIKPINYSLSLCNFLLGVANSVQCYRAYSFQKNMVEVASDETNIEKEDGVLMVLPASDKKVVN